MSDVVNQEQQEFDAVLSILKTHLKYTEDSSFLWKDVIGLLILKLTNTDSINKANDASNATQIQLTSEKGSGEGRRKTEDFFPTLTLNSTFKSWRICVPVRLHNSNIDSLTGETSASSELWKIDQVQIRRRLLNPDSNGGGNPTLHICYGNDLMPLRKALGVDDYIVFTKRKDSRIYEAFGVSKDIDLGKGKKMYVSSKNSEKDSTNFSLSEISIEEELPNNTTDEYKRAAAYIWNFISETGFEIPVKKDEIEKYRADFIAKFSPDKLNSLSDEELLDSLFYSCSNTNDSLCYWLEMKSMYKEYFGSVSGGSAFKFGLFQRQNTGEWVTGSPQKPKVLSENEALELGKRIKNALIEGYKIISGSNPETIDDYDRLDAELISAIGELHNWGWVHKYFSMFFPDKLSGFHSSDWQKHILYALRIKPSENYYTRSGQLALIGKYGEWYYKELFSVLYEIFGDIKRFIRIGTSDDSNNYALEWKNKSIVGIGWSEIGSLDEFVAGEKLDKSSIASKLKELYHLDDSVASRKAGEMIRFYNTDRNSVFVAMNGETPLALIDDIGEYYFNSSSSMSNIKPGTWHCIFDEAERLPNKKEGILTTCTQLTDEDNLLYLYEKYYYKQKSDIDMGIIFSDDSNENQKRFRAWMESQIVPAGELNAGQYYSLNLINQFVSNISNTPLPTNHSRSLFYTNKLEEVQHCLDILESSEIKNRNQISAVEKYLVYLKSVEEGNMPIQYNSGIESKLDRNRIVFGAPGTGKSYKLKKECEEFLSGTDGTYERVTFHPDYTYSQFVGTYKPISDGDSIKYKYVPGPFMRVLVDAFKSGRTDHPQPHILVIEEINRAKVAAVFGDVFQLLDRDDDGVSEYEIQTSEDIRKYIASELGGEPLKYSKIKLPDNMFIWATMNSADQGVYPMDTAFKRRWNFEYIGIDENEDKVRGKFTAGGEIVEWNALRKAINEKLSFECKVNEDKLMGPFFISKQVMKTVSDTDDTIADNDRFIEVFKSKVIMYLYEDAARQNLHRQKLFAGCDDTTKYSVVCSKFDEIGIKIFGENFEVAE